MTKYLLDTNICIYFLKGQFELGARIGDIGKERCLISEITVAELKFGAENSQKKDANRKVVDAFISHFAVLPIYTCLDIYAKEKARLRKRGIVIDDFDLLIGSTAISNDLTLVTNNEKHFKQMHVIEVENWALRQ